MKTLETIGENYFGHWDICRTACRGIIVQDGKILLSYETVTGQYMIPGGGLRTYMLCPGSGGRNRVPCRTFGMRA